MSDDLVNQLTLNFLISKHQLHKLNKKVKEISNERKLIETKEYSNRIKILFNDLLVWNPPEDLLFEVKTAFETFIDKSIYYFKTRDNSETLEKESNREIFDDIDFEKEERDIENGNYKELSNDLKENEEDEFEEEYEEQDEEEEQGEDGAEEEEEQKIIPNTGPNPVTYNEIISTNKSINHEPIVVKSKYKKISNSSGIDDIQKLPFDWFQNVRQNYIKNQIIPRKKEPSIIG
jgi:hypothetical protein